MRILPLALAATLTLAAPAAHAQDLSSEAHQLSSTNHGSSRVTVDAVTTLLGALGPNAKLLTDLWAASDAAYPHPITSIPSASITRHKVDGRQERWDIASPAMGRVIEADVLVGTGPVVFLFEGVDSPETSGWIKRGIAQKVFADSDATVIIPNQGRSSMWQDWRRDDPKLGRMKWETFYTKELAPLVDREIPNNGKRAAIGLSMGASGAVMMANNNPGFFDAVAGISGCYSTLDPTGRGTVELTVGNGGGSTANMWDASDWKRNDVTSHPEGLRGTRFYLSAATGEVTEADQRGYAGKPLTDQIGGTLLEAGSRQCTQRLDSALTRAGIEHTTNYLDRGVHDWSMFSGQLAPAWAAIRPALY